MSLTILPSRSAYFAVLLPIPSVTHGGFVIQERSKADLEHHWREAGCSAPRRCKDGVSRRGQRL